MIIPLTKAPRFKKCKLRACGVILDGYEMFLGEHSMGRALTKESLLEHLEKQRWEQCDSNVSWREYNARAKYYRQQQRRAT